MGKNRVSQLEFFSLGEDKGNNLSSANFRLRYVKDSQKVILLILIFLLTGVLSYGLGFKRGKSIALSNSNVKKEEMIIPPQEQIPEIKEEKTEVIPKEKNKEEKTNYTIQVATYKTSSYAIKEAEKLKKKGFSTMIINKGNYILLCVGSFLNKDDAKVFLTKLKKDYGDCFIRRF